MIERSRVRIPAGAMGEFSSPGSAFCVDSYFSICSAPYKKLVIRVESHAIAVSLLESGE